VAWPWVSCGRKRVEYPKVSTAATTATCKGPRNADGKAGRILAAALLKNVEANVTTKRAAKASTAAKVRLPTVIVAGH
jgi:hypothetical protein